MGFRLVLVAWLVAAFPLQAGASCSLHRAASLTLTLWQQKLFVHARLNGHDEPFTVDTGSATSILSQPVADELGLARDFDHSADTIGVGGAESRLAIVGPADLALDGVDLGRRTFPAAAFAQRLADGSPVAGLIGADILSRFDLELDIPGRRLDLWQVVGCTEVTFDWQGSSTSVPLDIEPSRHVAVPVRIEDAPLGLLLDTGSPGLVLSTHAAARAGASPETLEQGRRLRGAGVNDRAFEAWFHVFRRMQIGASIFGDVRAIVISPGRLQAEDGLLGLEALKTGRVWVSYATARLYLQTPRQ